MVTKRKLIENAALHSERLAEALKLRGADGIAHPINSGKDLDLQYLFAHAIDAMLDSLDVCLDRRPEDSVPGKFVSDILKDAPLKTRFMVAAHGKLNFVKRCRTYLTGGIPPYERTFRAWRNSEKVDLPLYLKTQDLVIGALAEKLTLPGLCGRIAQGSALPALCECAQIFGLKNAKALFEARLASAIPARKEIRGLSAEWTEQHAPRVTNIEQAFRALSSAQATDREKEKALHSLVTYEKFDLADCVEKLMQRGQLPRELYARFEFYHTARDAKEAPRLIRPFAVAYARCKTGQYGVKSLTLHHLQLMNDVVPKLGIPAARIIWTIPNDPRLEHAIAFAEKSGLGNIANLMNIRLRSPVPAGGAQYLSLMI